MLPVSQIRSMRLELEKSAEGQSDDTQKKFKYPHPALTLAKGVGGMALGTAAGYGASHLVQRMLQDKYQSPIGVTPKTLSYILPATGAAMGLLVPLFHGKMLKDMKGGYLERQEAKKRVGQDTNNG